MGENDMTLWTDEDQVNWKQAYTSLIEFGRAGLTSSAFLNGGAAAAIVAAGAADPTVILKQLFWALLCFCTGAASALFALGFAYFAEFCLMQQHRGANSIPKYKRYEAPTRWLATGAGAASIIMFVVGIWAAFYVLS
ncbi:hypothetical protein [Desulfovibrio sp. Fe33]|uniref:hypothetical protein n=1 Tax=Desulfovibrio sp. Fe33 TaxID=3020842 RepID=UPI00234E1751|nr:hypothetical protein [Desulfovibrio sp. Fe33]